MGERVADARRPATATSRAERTAARVDEAAELEERLRSVLRRQTEVKQSFQKAIAESRCTARALHDENVALRNIISAELVRIRHAGCPARKGMPANITEAECEQLRLRIHLARRRRNRLGYEVTCLQNQLRVSAEQQRWCEGAALEPCAPSAAGAQRSLMVRICALERRLDRTLREQGLVKAILEQYRSHAQILENESKSYDAQTQALESEFVDRHRDHLQLAAVYKNAQLALQRVLQRRTQFLHTTTRLRAAQEAALGEKKAAVDAALAVTQHAEVHQRGELQQRLQEEAALLQAAEVQHAQLEQLQRRGTLGMHAGVALSRERPPRSVSGTTPTFTDDEDDAQRLREYETVFHTLLRAAKVDSLAELERAFEEQATRRRHVHDELQRTRQSVAELEERVRQLRSLKLAQTATVGAAATTSRLMTTQLRHSLAHGACALQAQASHNATAETDLREALRRLGALAALTAHYRPDVVLPHTLDYPPTKDMAGIDGLRVHLGVLTQKLIALADDATTPQTEQDALAPYTTSLVIPAHNLRIALPRSALPPSVAEVEMEYGADFAVEGGGEVEVGWDEDSSCEHERVYHDASVSSPARPTDMAVGSGTPRTTAESGRRRRRVGRPESAPQPDSTTSEDPLRREEIKKMSDTITLREQRRRQRELAQNSVKSVF